jgi:hypothetical protein
MTDVLKQAHEFFQLITDSEDGPPTQRSPLVMAEPAEDFRTCQELRDSMLGRGLRVGKVHKGLQSASYFNLPYPERSDYIAMLRSLIAELGSPSVHENGFVKWSLPQMTITLTKLENRLVVRVNSHK